MDPLAWIFGLSWTEGLFVSAIFALLVYALTHIYFKRRSFRLTLTIGTVQQQDHGGKHELIIPHQFTHSDDKRSTECIKIEEIAHEIGWPKLRKITEEHGSESKHKELYTTLKFNETTGQKPISYNMGKKIPEKCKLKTIVKHTYGTKAFT